MAHEILTRHRSSLAEGPLWHPEHQRVYWVDIDLGALYRFDPSSGASELVHKGSKIGGFTLEQDGALLLFREHGVIERWSNSGTDVVVGSIPGETSRFNDVAADPSGAVFCGTMPTDERSGRLYRLTPDGDLSVVLEGVGCSNGIGWSPDRRTMYHTDSSTRTISSFDYDESSGRMERQRPFFVLYDSSAVPDGMTVDANGHIWTALWGGGCLIELDPEGNEVQRIDLPANKVTCPTFGGPEYQQLYVTTAGGDKPNEGDGAGELLRVEVAARGIPEFRSRIGQGAKETK